MFGSIQMQIGYLTKRIYRSYTMMSPWIVLLFLGLVVALCKAENQPGDITITPSGTDKVTLSCDDSAVCDKPEENCNYKWYHTSIDDNNLEPGTGQTYDVPRNADYYCKTNNSAGHKESAAHKVDTLTATPVVSRLPTDDKVCGKEEIEIKCAASTPSVNNKPTVQMQILRGSHVVKEWADADAELKMKVSKGDQNGDYTCEARAKKVTTEALKSVSVAAVTVTCTACTKTPGVSASCPLSGNTECNTGVTPHECVNPADTTAAPSVPPNTNTNPADHTTGVSGGGGKDTTGDGSGGTTSGASDLGRPASVLTIVCSLLTLTLALRG